MSEPLAFLSDLARSAFGRGQAVPAAPAVAQGQPDAPAQAAGLTSSDVADEALLPGGFDPGIVGVLGEKILLAWLRNRYQLLFPFPFDLRRLDAKHAELVVHAMVAAAQADGTFDGKERARIESALLLALPQGGTAELVAAALERPKPLPAVLSEARDVQTGALLYAASLLAIDQRKPVNRHYLRYLAARLQLSEELVGSLEQRFRSSA